MVFGAGYVMRPLGAIRLRARQEVRHGGHVAIGLLRVRQVPRLLEQHPLRLWDDVGDELHLHRRGLVVATAGEQDRAVDRVQAG